MDNDARLDIVVANNIDNNVSVLLGYGNGSFASQITYSTGSSPYSVVVGDFNGDTKLDIVVANKNDNNVGILLGYVSVVLANETTLKTGDGSRPQSFAIGDLNNDDRIDIVVVNSGSNSIGIFLGYGNNSFTYQTTYLTDVYPLSVAVGHFNNDIQLDIVVANSLSDSVSVFLGYGNGSFSSQKTFTTGSYSQPYSVAIGDFNGDTFTDIIVANHGIHNVGVLLGYGNGKFGDTKMFTIGLESLPFLIGVGDFNNDQKLDFVVANEGTDNLKILLQTC